MLKKLLFILMLAFQAAVVVNTASAEDPWPNCFPCPPPPPPPGGDGIQ